MNSQFLLSICCSFSPWRWERVDEKWNKISSRISQHWPFDSLPPHTLSCVPSEKRFLSRQFHFAAQIHSVHSFIRSLWCFNVIYSASRQRYLGARAGRLGCFFAVDERMSERERDKNENQAVKHRRFDWMWCLCLIRKFAQNSRKIGVGILASYSFSALCFYCQQYT